MSVPVEQQPVSVDEHLDRVLSVVAPLQPIPLRLGDAHGCVLAEEVVTAHPLPGFDNSAMDGYAVRVDDVTLATPSTPVRLPVVADLPAGTAPTVRVQPGFCVRIMTGAPVPAGADAVVPVEWTDGGIAEVLINRAPQPGANIRRAGEDLAAGAVVLPAGSHLGAAQVGLLAAAGRGSVLVQPRPRVVVVSTGSELVEAGEPLAPGQLHDSNSHSLAAAVREAGAVAYRVGIVRDDPRLLMDTLEDQLVRADMVITSGGVSVGAYDVVKAVLSRLGSVWFGPVAMQPGMPQGFGVIGHERTPIFCLPGNPVSSLVSFEVFVRPALRRMLAAEPLHRPLLQVTLNAPLRKRPGKRQYARVIVRRAPDGTYVADQVGGPGSHLLASMAAANALLVVPEHVSDVPAGATLPAMLLERRTR